MQIIEENDVSLLSHIIYVIYNTEDIDRMRYQILKLIKYAVPFDTANFYLIETGPGNTQKLTKLVNVNTLKNPNVEGILNEYAEKCQDIDRTHWLCEARKNIAYRTTDFLSAETLEDTDYYKEMFVPYNVHFGAQVVLTHNDTCVGLLTCFRAKDQPNFSDREIFFLDCLKDHLSIRLYQSIVRADKIANYQSEIYMRKYNLTMRESEILDMLFLGLTDEAIAEQLFIAQNTLRKHIYNLFGKLGIKHRWQLYFLN